MIAESVVIANACLVLCSCMNMSQAGTGCHKIKVVHWILSAWTYCLYWQSRSLYWVFAKWCSPPFPSQIHSLFTLLAHLDDCMLLFFVILFYMQHVSLQSASW